MDQTKKYRFSRLYKGLAYVGIVFFIGINFMWFIPTEKQFNHLGFSISLIICVPLIACGIKQLRMVDDEVVVEGQGIRYIPKRGSAVYLPWEQISKVIAKDLSRRLQLYDIQGNNKINLEYHLDDFAELRDIIFQNTKHLQNKNLAGNNNFRLSYLSVMYIIVSTLVVCWFVWFSLHEYNSSLRYLTVLFLFIPLYLNFCTIHKLQINKDYIIVFYTLRQKMIPFTEVKKIYMQNTSDRYGNIHAAVIIEYGKNKKVGIAGFREGSFSVYSSLETTWSSMKKNAI